MLGLLWCYNPSKIINYSILHDEPGCAPFQLWIFLQKVRDLSEISRGEGGGNRGRITTFWDSEKRGVMKNGPLKGGGLCNYMPVITSRLTHRRKRKFFIWLKKKKRKKNQEQGNIMDINCEVLLQELNKHLLFIYNNAIESYWNYEWYCY